jgi:hypothetical protein
MRQQGAGGMMASGALLPIGHQVCVVTVVRHDIIMLHASTRTHRSEESAVVHAALRAMQFTGQDMMSTHSVRSVVILLHTSGGEPV